LRLQDSHRFLRSGGAFGRGCGPLVIVRDAQAEPQNLNGATVAIPGELTTAYLLLRLFTDAMGCRPAQYIPMVFHEIMPAVAEGRADAGVIIHESRFTYQTLGLHRLVDLGAWWEETTGLPIPLGGIIAQKSLGVRVIEDMQELIRTSLAYTRTHPDEAMPFIRQHAQELADTVIQQHIELYVNDFSVDAGAEGAAALAELAARAKAAGL
jgi:1,4-dihydroxy-6-naphthoate synthase